MRILFVFCSVLEPQSASNHHSSGVYNRILYTVGLYIQGGPEKKPLTEFPLNHVTTVDGVRFFVKFECKRKN